MTNGKCKNGGCFICNPVTTVAGIISYDEVKKIAIKYKKGDRYYIFLFENGKMTGTETNLPYTKSYEDWQFQSEAIHQILKEAESRNLDWVPLPF